MEALDLFSEETEYLNTLLQKLICKSIVPNMFRKQRGIFYQKKKSSGDKWTQAKKPQTWRSLLQWKE